MGSESKRLTRGYVKYLLALVAGFEIWDGIITHFLVREGLVREGNPLMEGIIMEGNFLMLKIVGALFSVVILWWFYQRRPRLALPATTSIAVFYGAVVAWNLGVLLSA